MTVILCQSLHQILYFILENIFHKNICVKVELTYCYFALIEVF